MPDLLRERYELLEVVGQGGEGRVLKARDTQHDRVVALKIRDVRSEQDRGDLLSEARILLAISPHPHLPLVREDFFDTEHFDGEKYVIAMDWVEGTDLAQLLRARGRPGLAPSLVMQWLADAAAALTHLHTQVPPVIHGDIKPANLILSEGGRVTMVDFGLSSAPDAPNRRGGTRGFAAPEVTSDGQRSRASDVYSLAATAFALLTGDAPVGIRPAWDGIEPAEAAALEDAIRSGLATDPTRRVKTPGELVERLRAGWGATLPTGVLTFCFTDIEGSTAMWAQHPAEMAKALVLHDELIAATAEAHGGRFLKSMGEGDATVSVFLSPAAALTASIEMVRALGTTQWPTPLAINARFGLHTGEAEHRGDDYFGPTLNLAARIRALPSGQQIFLSRATAQLVASQLGDGVTLVDLGDHQLKGIDAPERVFAVRADGVDAPPPPTCPYPGLLAFEAEDRERFFGRDTAVNDLVDRVAKGGVVTIIGASGSGKSSVLRAGLTPRFPGATVTTPGPHPQLEAGVGLLIIDQFEELFTMCDNEDERGAFVDALVASDRPIAIGLRADFYGECAQYPALARAMAANQILLGPMSNDELHDAITKPAEVAQLTLEPGLVDVVIADVAGEPGALPLLSHALAATWEARNGRTLTLAGYRSTGGVRGAIARTADAVLADFDDDQRGAARQLFLRLTALGDGLEDTRRRVSRSEVTDGMTNRLVDRLADVRLITVDDGVIEVAHEALIREWPTLRAWLDEDRDGLRARQRLADAAVAWDRSARPTSDLYRGARLASVDGLADLAELERDFVAASESHQQREVRRLRLGLAGVAVALVVALVAGSLAFVSRGRAATNARNANVSRLAALSRAVREKHPDLGLLLAVESSRLRDSAETRGALVGALQQNPRLVGELHGIDSGLESAVYSPDGRILATPSFDGTILWDTATRQRIGHPLRDKQHIWESAAFSPDGASLATVGDLGVVSLWDVKTKKVRRRIIDPDGQYAGRVAWSPNGAYIATGGGDGGNRVVVYDTATGTVVGAPIVSTEAKHCALAQPAFTADSQLIAVAGDCGRVNFWRVPSLERLEPLAVTKNADANIFAVATDSRRAMIAAATQDGEVSVWDLTTRTQLGPTMSVGATPALSVGFSADGRYLAAGSADGRSFVFRRDSGELFGEPLSANSGRINAVAFSPDSAQLATASYDRSGAIWDLTGRQPLGHAIDPLQSAWTTAVAYGTDGKELATATSTDDGANGDIWIRDKSQPSRKRGYAPPSGVQDVAFIPHTHTLAVAANNGTVSFIGAARSPIAVKDRWITNIEFSPTGETLALATDPNAPRGYPDPSRNGDVRLFDRSGDAKGAIHPHAGTVAGLAFSPDGLRLLVVSDGQRAAIYDVRTRKPVGRPMTIADTSLAGGAFSPDGRLVAFGGFSGQVELRDAATQKRTTPVLHADPLVSGITFTRDGAMLATTTMYGHTQLWDARTGEAIGEPLVGGITPVPASRFVDFQFPAYNAVSPDGRTLAAGGIDGAAMVWDIAVDTWPTRACSMAGRNLTRVEWRQYLGSRPYRQTCPQWRR